MKANNKYLPLAVFYLFVQLIFLLVINVVTVFSGLFVVAFGLPFLQEGVSNSDGRKIYNLPKWLWLWGNDADGADGDKRLWWDRECDKLAFFGIFPFLRSKGFNVPTLTSKSYWSRYWWLAIRNPSNNLRFIPWLACFPNQCAIWCFGQNKVKDKIGFEGWQLVCAVGRDLRTFPLMWMGFYYVMKYPNSNFGLRIRLGYKVEPEDRYSDKNKSVGFSISVIPKKDLT